MKKSRQDVINIYVEQVERAEGDTDMLLLIIGMLISEIERRCQSAAAKIAFDAANVKAWEDDE